ncbi:MAG: GntR family transcriptional regulator [Burkholderiaceae bacterium]|nr:GntR family transcriptional regulator [Burkholderiaceae bacterium]
MPAKNPASISRARPLALVAGQPRYLQLAQTLLNEIEAGKHPVGSQLPTELALCEQFGVSRATAREAVKRLVQMGLVVRQPRVGSTVRAQTASTVYRQNMADVDDLYQYAQDTTLVIESSQTREIDAAQAALLEAAPGETWLHMKGRRHTRATPDPICLTELWLHPAFRSIQGIAGPLGQAVHSAVEQQFGEVIAKVEQEIRAVALGRAQARLLGVAPRSPALWVCRKYRNRLDQLVELAMSTHPAGRFSYSTVLRREWGAQELAR